MKADLSHLDKYRDVLYERQVAGVTGHPNGGILNIPSKVDGKLLRVSFSRGTFDFIRWDHVAISHRKRVPNWYEMCQIKELFFEDEEAVMQLHPPKSEWISNANNCLHLFRPIDQIIPLPPSELVGIKGLNLQNVSVADLPRLQDEALARLHARLDTPLPVLNSEPGRLHRYGEIPPKRIVDEGALRDMDEDVQALMDRDME